MNRYSSRLILAVLLALLAAPAVWAEDGYELWLRYHPISETALLQHYRASVSELVMEAGSPTLEAAR
ncbi:MAG TPA: hypothetical protein VFG50_09760, partial [Rhodothermales bacterium]|nr:hypothetical protein [Rhodothermales bacterium]